MGLLDKIESVIPGHHKTDAEKDHTTHTDATRTDSAVGEHGTSQHHHFGHSSHGLTSSHTAEHSAVTPASGVVHKEEHATVPGTGTTTAGSTTTHDLKSTSAPITTEHATSVPSGQTVTTSTVPVPASTTSGSSVTGHTAGTKLDGPADAPTHHLSGGHSADFGTASMGHHDLHSTSGTTDHSLKHEHGSTGILGHHDHHTTSDGHKSEHGVTGVLRNLTGSHDSGHQHESTNTGTEKTSSLSGGHANEHASTTTPVTTAAGNTTHQGVNFIPNAENPASIPTAGGRNIGAGQVDHNATGTIGKEYPGDKSIVGSTSEHVVTPNTTTTTTTTGKDASLPDRTTAPAAPPYNA